MLMLMLSLVWATHPSGPHSWEFLLQCCGPNVLTICRLGHQTQDTRQGKPSQEDDEARTANGNWRREFVECPLPPSPLSTSAPAVKEFLRNKTNWAIHWKRIGGTLAKPIKRLPWGSSPIQTAHTPDRACVRACVCGFWFVNFYVSGVTCLNFGFTSNCDANVRRAYSIIYMQMPASAVPPAPQGTPSACPSRPALSTAPGGVRIYLVAF